MTTTDPVGGLSVMLPGQPTVQTTTLLIDGGSRAVLFEVIDAAFRSIDFDKSLQGGASAYPKRDGDR
ncbi:MAG: hypothetical protein ACRDRO_02680 [Pseudonocardiaceae bacterium]